MATAENALDPAQPLQVGCSPRAQEADLDVFVSLVRSARRDVLFATAFDIAPRVYEALTGQPHDPILRYGVQDKATTMTGTHADRTADFQAAAALPEGLDGWLKEHRVPGQTGNILIHTKVIVVDFTSDSPIVISGSHNFSHKASANNDENYLIFRGNKDIADCYGIEVLRIYDHYRFRYVEGKAAAKKRAQPPTLTPDDSWTDDYFDSTKLKYADRLRFVGDPEHQAKTASPAHPARKAAAAAKR
jgi:phosphatidylserine/phosphatidylglycerophosphate/cardiolipin synthase-like enzyme